MKHLDVQANALKELPENRISMIAGCDLFFRFVTRHPAESDFEPWKAKIVQLGESMVQNCQSHRTSAAMSGVKFIKEDSVILVHSYSRVVMMLLKLAFAQCRFKVIVTDAKPSDSGRRAVAELRGEGIPAALINDAAVGTVIGKVDMVLVGAEGVVQNGGIINQVGTYQVAVVAKAVNKPVYCVTESYKFVQLFPLNQDDLPITSSMYFKDEDDNGEIKMSNTTIDFTPPAYISLIFTNVGVLTPSGVAEQLSMLLVVVLLPP
ncbi:hypothetical protein BC831DRAFT_423045 [Entophlyctis helioformis]|nr:hypothetical protein BC831DRAFT_423045 [Entophlyctis helioformis]